MFKIPKQEYTAEFKELAVKRVAAGEGIAAVARDLGLVEQTLRNWMKAARNGKLNPQSGKAITPEQMELSRVRAENARLRMENEILKNGPHGLPRPSCIETSGEYPVGARGQWPRASWRYLPRQKTWPRGSCGPICGGAFG